MTSVPTRASPSHAARTRTLGIGLALLTVLSLTGCIPVDAGSGGSFAINESDVPVIVSITRTDFSAEASQATGGVVLLGEGADCIGDGVVVKDLDGNVIAIFDGAVCDGTTLRILDDWTIEYSVPQGRTESEPAIPMPTTTAPTP